MLPALCNKDISAYATRGLSKADSAHAQSASPCDCAIRKLNILISSFFLLSIHKVVQIWPGQTVTCLHTNRPGYSWTTLYIVRHLTPWRSNRQMEGYAIKCTSKCLLSYTVYLTRTHLMQAQFCYKSDYLSCIALITHSKNTGHKTCRFYLGLCYVSHTS
jgi:hypothetical protein